MEIKSKVPQSEEEAILGKPFEFGVLGNIFQIKPLTMYAYYEAEKRMHRSLQMLYYLGIDLDKELKKQLDVNLSGFQGLHRAKTIIDIVVRIMEPIQIRDLIRMIVEHNRKYQFKPHRWVLSLSGWLHENLGLDQVIDLASYIMRYCSETKKKILNAIQNGITNITDLEAMKTNPDQSGSTEEEWKPGFQSLGQQILGLS